VSTAAPAAPRCVLALGDWLATAARQRPDQRCFVQPDERAPDGKREATFAETSSRVNRLARSLQARGLGKGDRIGIVAVDSIEHAELVLACFKVGIVVCDLNYRLKAPELVNILTRCPVQAMFSSARYGELLDEVDRSGAFSGWRCSLDGPEDNRVSSYESLLAGAGDDRDFSAGAHGEDLVMIAFTSGTTGIPKGVMQSERMLRNISLSGIRETRLRPGGLRYSGAPLFHISGLGSYLYALGSGAGSLVLTQFDPAVALWWLQHEEITSCLLVPTMISSLLALEQSRAASYPHLRGIMYGGSPMSPALLRSAITVFRCDLYNGFGAGTEAGGQTMLDPEDHVAAMNGKPHLLGSIGRPILGVDLRLCDDELNDVAPGEIGEIVTRSNTVMSGYFGQPDLTARALVDGWFRAGDMARQDRDGYLYLEARKSDLIIRGGENVYPVEIESTLTEHRAVRAAAVIGIPDPHWGELVAAVVELDPGTALDPGDLESWCRERLASYKVPAHVFVVETLPTTASGKVLKSQVRQHVIERLEMLDARH
jgi:acyl-CoA synthetase (AMP-forming)/AMP-acid ligase II